MSLRYHIFIAHSARDEPKARRLYSELASDLEVFQATECLLPGDSWDSELASAQKDSLITVVLVSKETEKAYYQREEITTAIALARDPESQHRVVPVYIDGTEDVEVPYGLRRIHSISLKPGDPIRSLAKILGDLLKRLKVKVQTRAGDFLVPAMVLIHHVHLADTPSHVKKTPKPSKELERLKLIDEATGLLIMALKQSSRVSLLYIDLDKFLHINNKFGEDLGDKIIASIEDLLREIHGDDSVFRLGDDQFLVWLQDTTELDALEIAEHSCAKIEKQAWGKMAPGLCVTASVGVCQVGEDQEVEEWIIRAIHGADFVKRSGGNGVESGPLAIPRYWSRRVEAYLS